MLSDKTALNALLYVIKTAIKLSNKDVQLIKRAYLQLLMY